MNGPRKQEFESQIRHQIRAVYEKTKQIAFLPDWRATSPRHLEPFLFGTKTQQACWSTDAAGGNEEDLERLKSLGSFINPLFVNSMDSREEFSVHHTTDPLICFHLAKAFDSEDNNSHVQHMVRTAKQQFQAWCDSWMQTSQFGKVCIRLHCGDAISLCHRLQNMGQCKLPLFTSQWRAVELDLDGDSTELYTSNVADWAGILALLPAVIPLMNPHPAAILYTNFLVPAADKTSETLEEALCCDPTTMFALIGLAPMGHLTKSTLDMSSRDLAIFMVAMLLNKSDQTFKGMGWNFLRIPWKYPSSGDGRVVQADSVHSVSTADPDRLASFLFSTYLKMFGALRFYTRAGFIMLIALVRRKTETDWPHCINQLSKKMHADRSLPKGSNRIQEVLAWLHIVGLWDSPEFFRRPVRSSESFRSFEASWQRLYILSEHPTPPHIIFMTLAVPALRSTP